MSDKYVSILNYLPDYRFIPSKSVYILVDPRNSQIRYVGATSNTTARLYDHMNCDGNNIDKDQWINDLKAQGYKPLLIVIEIGPKHAIKEAERQWIEKLAHAGAPLTNKNCLPERHQLDLFEG